MGIPQMTVSAARRSTVRRSSSSEEKFCARGCRPGGAEAGLENIRTKLEIEVLRADLAHRQAYEKLRALMGKKQDGR